MTQRYIRDERTADGNDGFRGSVVRSFKAPANLEALGVVPPGGVLVLRVPEGFAPETAGDLVESIQAVIAGPVVLVPAGWTREEVDAKAVRAAVAAEREACAMLVETASLKGSYCETAGDVREALAVMIRERGKAGAS